MRSVKCYIYDLPLPTKRNKALQELVARKEELYKQLRDASNMQMEALKEEMRKLNLEFSAKENMCDDLREQLRGKKVQCSGTTVVPHRSLWPLSCLIIAQR